MKRLPQSRHPIYDLYWRFAAERHAIFQQRVAGMAPPWTQDPILQTYKFCNVFRAADRVSQYLIREIAYSDETVGPVDRLFQIVAFRVFSKIETWQTVWKFLGHHPTLDDLADGSFPAALDHAKLAQGGLYTGAFILCASNLYGYPTKHQNHIALFRHMFLHDALGERLLDATSLRQVYELLLAYPLIGSFMAYQIAVDLNYSDLLNFSEDEFTQAGPGAKRGIHKAFVNLGDYSLSDVIHWMVDHQDQEFARLSLRFDGLWGRRLHAIDCQAIFCALDKYCRVAAPELKSNRKRIKARFTPSRGGLRLYFPPKWHLNDKLPQGEVLGAALPARGRRSDVLTIPLAWETVPVDRRLAKDNISGRLPS